MPDADIPTATRRTQMLLACSTAGAALVLALLLAVPAALLLGPPGALVAVVLALLVAGGGAAAVRSGSHRVALAATGARPADPTAHARLHNLIEGLCVASGLPKPGVWVIEDEAANALAVARRPDDAAVVVTTGLLEVLTRIELEGVLAQELGRIRSGDATVGSLAAVCLGGLPVLSPPALARGEAEAGPEPSLTPARLALPLLVLAPVTAWLVARSTPEPTGSHADLAAVEITRYPPGLARALEKLAATPGPRGGAPSIAHLWLVPGAGPRRSAIDRLYDTPPPLEQRIVTLQEL